MPPAKKPTVASSRSKKATPKRPMRSSAAVKKARPALNKPCCTW